MKPTKEKSDAFKNTLEKLKSQFADKSSESKVNKLNLEKMSYNPKTDEQISLTAKELADANYLKKSEKEKTDFEEKKNEALSSIEQLKKQTEDNKKSIDDNYVDSKKELENQSIKRGLQRSSIVMGQLDNLEQMKLSDKSEISNTLNQKIERINGEIQSLSDSLNKSLKKLDMQKAIEINDKIDELKTEREVKLNEVKKYNNQVLEKETEYNNSLLEKYPETIKKEKEEMEVEIANEIINYFREYDDPKEAYEDFLNDESMSGYLGKNYNFVKNILNARF